MPFSHRCVAVPTVFNRSSASIAIAHHCIGAASSWSQICVIILNVLVARHCGGVTDLLDGVGLGVIILNVLVARRCEGVTILLNGLGVAGDVGGGSGHAPH